MNNKDIYKKTIDQIHADDSLKNSTFEKIEEKQKTRHPIVIRYLAACAVFIVLFSVGAFYFKDGFKRKEKKEELQIAQAENVLSRFENIDQIREILKENELSNYYTRKGVIEDSATENAIPSPATGSGTNTADANTDVDYSKTNIQVDGVDEADIVKTDGKYIYYVANEKVYIIDAQDLKIQSIIEPDNKEYEFSPSEIYINKDKLIAIGDSYETMNIETEEEEVIYYKSRFDYGKTMAKATVYDISDKKHPKEVREVSIDGYYNNSRMIGDCIYFISDKDIYYGDTIKNEEILPNVKDTAVSNNTSKIECTDIAYFKGSNDSNYLMVAAFDVNKKEPATIETLFGAGSEIYASADNLYITQSNYRYFLGNEITKTKIYKFNLNNNKILFKATTEIKGTINDQFSMDEYDGNLRIATTSSQYDEDKSKNQLFILNENLEEIGRIDNMAKGESIYSVRFVGKVGYIVTFKQIDPLFVIDLSDPRAPEIKGELKIPGYSSYLHPYDETHIIGIGYNTKSNGYGGVTNDNMKISMFDVSNLKNPREMFSVDIGESYGYSEITSNHKALFYNKEKKLIGFPVTVLNKNNRYSTNSLVLYKIDLDKGFVEYGEIEQENDRKNNIKRAIYIGDILYTLTEYKVTAYSLDSLAKIHELELDK